MSYQVFIFVLTFVTLRYRDLIIPMRSPLSLSLSHSVVPESAIKLYFLCDFKAEL